ncbi:MAG: hypothetical protein EAZ89_03090 [Bacteroidetes bacterium]|nr:MAG: hypothetical protein EAZ89_03090 [Bacteroidota bacterium]
MENLMKFSDYARSRGKHISVAVCPITTNAMEIPDMVRFCNEKGMRIFFNTVSYPFELCIKNMPVSDIAAILQAYEEAAFGEIAPEDTLAQENLRDFGSLVAQVRAWKQGAEAIAALRYSPELIRALEAFVPSLQSPMADALLALHQTLLTGDSPDMESMRQLHAQANSPADHAASYMETLAVLTGQSHFLNREQNERFQSAMQRLLLCCEQEQKWEDLAAVTLRVLPDKVVTTLLSVADSNPLLMFAALKQL